MDENNVVIIFFYNTRKLDIAYTLISQVNDLKKNRVDIKNWKVPILQRNRCIININERRLHTTCQTKTYKAGGSRLSFNYLGLPLQGLSEWVS